MNTLIFPSAVAWPTVVAQGAHRGHAACDWPGQAGQIKGCQQSSLQRGTHADTLYISPGQHLIQDFSMHSSFLFLVQRIPELREAAAHCSGLSYLFFTFWRPSLPIGQSALLPAHLTLPGNASRPWPLLQAVPMDINDADGYQRIRRILVIPSDASDTDNLLTYQQRVRCQILTDIRKLVFLSSG